MCNSTRLCACALKNAEHTFNRERDALMSGSATRYDQIGYGYGSVRRPDARLAAGIATALGDATSVVNVGAGTGSYEPTDRRVVAVEPSCVMLAQRPPGSAPAVQAVAERLPFTDGAFDAATAFMTIHHWPDQEQGLREPRRVARQRVVVLTWDPVFARGFWLTRYYLPEILALDVSIFRPVPQIVASLGGGLVQPAPIPHDCTDGFLGAYWRRPEAYLEPHVRAGISPLARLGEAVLLPDLQRLADDLRSGAWDRANGHLRHLETLDLGYRLVVHTDREAKIGTA
jgi:hypothetical protein